MTTKEGPFSRILFRYLPLGIAIISALLSGATFWNNIYQQDRDLGRKELMIRPYLTFFQNKDFSVENTYQISLSLHNDGLGPAVVQEVIFGADGECTSSSSFSNFSDWDKFYQTKIAAQFEKLLSKDIEAQISSDSWLNVYSLQNEATRKIVAPNDVPAKKLRRESTKDKGFDVYDVYEVQDVYGVDSLNSKYHMAPLNPGAIVSAGSSYEIASLEAKLTTRVTKIERKKSTEKPLEPTSDAASGPAAGTMLKNSFDALGIGIWYCSFSGMYCNFASQGNRQCFAEFEEIDEPLNRIDQPEPLDNRASFP